MNKYHFPYIQFWNLIKVLFAGIVFSCITSGIVNAYNVNIEPPVNVGQTASLGDVFSKINSNSVAISEIPIVGSMSAKDCNDRGITYSQEGQYDLAIADFNNALAIDPQLAETYNNRGIAYAKKGQYDRAISDFTRAVEINSTLSESFYNLGITYATIGELERAISNLDKALEINSSDASAYLARSAIYMKLTCLDWRQLCNIGICNYFMEATKTGLCNE
ncbi:MAG TPA: tetratricopeptide repeat protein [Thermodesulfovibrionales bacterium]|nr:tetratricopeptide repeat protein [Thermodesulfovibrionales bacterium]